MDVRGEELVLGLGECVFRDIAEDVAVRAEKNKALAESRQPLPIDPKLKGLRDTVELVSQPVPPDALLTQLQADVVASTRQLTEKRLTVAQDIAWALINSPAFLFNH